MAKRADLFLIAPATANIMGKMACGIADDMLSTTVMATRAPVLVAPAMNTGHVGKPPPCSKTSRRFGRAALKSSRRFPVILPAGTTERESWKTLQ